MKKEENIKPISPYEEMNSVREELEETLPIEPVGEGIPEEKEDPDYLDEVNPKSQAPTNQSQPLMFSDERTDNLVMWQLRVDWERVEHIVRGHKPMVDKEGNEYFTRMQEHYLNDYGVNSILHFLSFYLSKEIFLARYSKEKVDIIMKNFAMQFTDFFYDNIIEFGLNTPSKKKMSKMFVQAVIDLVDASYSKAIEGKTAELINKQFQVLQQQPLEDHNPYPTPMPNKRAGMMSRIFG